MHVVIYIVQAPRPAAQFSSLASVQVDGDVPQLQVRGAGVAQHRLGEIQRHARTAEDDLPPLLLITISIITIIIIIMIIRVRDSAHSPTNTEDSWSAHPLRSGAGVIGGDR